jgi:hypothetical protein
VIKSDLIRELSKIEEALRWAEKHLCLTNEANAALHCNERVFYSPLTTQVHEARESASRILVELTETPRDQTGAQDKE